MDLSINIAVKGHCMSISRVIQTLVRNGFKEAGIRLRLDIHNTDAFNYVQILSLVSAP